MSQTTNQEETGATNDQLWKIIERQRATIQALQSSQSKLQAEREFLVDKAAKLERELAQCRPSRLVAGDEFTTLGGPFPPGRRPSTPISPPPIVSPSQFIIDRDAQTFAKYQASMNDQGSHPERPGPELEEDEPRKSVTAERWLVRLVGSNIKTNEKGKSVVFYVLSVGRKPEGSDDGFLELWRIEKLYSDFLSLDAKLKASGDRTITSKLGKLPEKQLFVNSRTSSKMDQRKVTLEHYLQQIMSLPHHDLADLTEFLSSNLVESAKSTHHKAAGQQEGFLFKRGKNFGGWKARYFILNGTSLDYYETRDGNHLGSITLHDCRLGLQASPNFEEEISGGHRHGFLILEQKRPGPNGVVRHMLYANSEEEREAWIQALKIAARQATSHSANKNAKVSKIDIRPIAAAPLGQSASTDSKDLWNLPLSPSAYPEPTLSSSEDMTNESSTSLDSSQSAVRRNSTTNLRSPGADEPRSPTFPTLLDGFRSSDDLLGQSEGKLKHMGNRVTFWGKKMSSGINISGRLSPSSSADIPRMTSVRSMLMRSSNDAADASEEKPVFGIPLEEAVRISRIKEGYELPAIVYRCIEYLDAKGAVLEEGLYRLSGGATDIQRLKHRFNQGDFNLLNASEQFDVHAVAGVLKLWLRELPTNVLTREHLPDFLHVTDLVDRKDRINELGRLVSLLPLTNYTLLRALIVHLICVVQQSEINKMNIRNVGIVFSPTLRIPPTIFHLLITEFEYVFWTTDDGNAAPRKLESDVVAKSPQEHQDNTPQIREESGRSNRNSISYIGNAPLAIKSLEKTMDDRPRIVDDDDEVSDLGVDDSQAGLSLDLTSPLKQTSIIEDNHPLSPQHMSVSDSVRAPVRNLSSDNSDDEDEDNEVDDSESDSNSDNSDDDDDDIPIAAAKLKMKAKQPATPALDG